MNAKLFIAHIFGASGNFLSQISHKINPPPPPQLSIREQRAAPWFEINGDKTLRLEYNDLDSGSVVFDVGGFEGQWASDIYSKYRPKIYIFEPVSKHQKDIEARFKKNPDIKVYGVGLAGRSRSENISLDGDQSSVLKPSLNSQKIKLKSATDFMQENNIKYIDLIKINIEGGEYELIEHLIETGVIKSIGNIQVQFHDFDFIKDAEKRMKNIQKLLNKTHTITYQYPFIWENWTINPAKKKKYEG